MYIISIKDQSNCIQEFNDSVNITVKQLPELHLNEDDICVGAHSYYLNKATPNGGIYFINNIMTDYFDVENLDPDDYIIRYEYTNPNTSCKNEVSDIITISESPKAAMIISPENTDIDDPNILFTDNSNEDILISEWELGDGTIIYNEKSFWHTYTDTGTYTIKYYVENIYGCTDSIANNLIINSIYSIFIPDAFSPNNDGENDYFYPSIIGSNDYNMKIYNRWGELIYNEYNGKWDGTISNDFIQIGSYSYSISVSNLENETIEYTGTCTILR